MNNNDRNWFEKHKDEYLAAKEDFENFLEKLLPKMQDLDPSLKGIQVKDCLFRIYRDVRFSNDKRPYKTHLGAWLCGRGRKSPGPGYYFHLQPGESFVAAGIWMPDAPMLAAIRQEIDYNLDEFNSILNNKEFKKYFKKIDVQDQLKTAPKGYPKDHPGIELLKLKSFTVSYPLKDEVLLKPAVVKEAEKAFSAVMPFNSFLGRALD